MSNSYLNSDLTPEVRANALLEELSTEEKVDQICGIWMAQAEMPEETAPFTVSFEWEDAEAEYKNDETISNLLSDSEKQELMDAAQAAVEATLDALVELYGADEISRDPFFVFTCARAGYYPEGTDPQQMLSVLMDVWQEYADVQAERGRKPETIETAKFVLAVTALGFDAADAEGVNLIDALAESDPNNKFYAEHV